VTSGELMVILGPPAVGKMTVGRAVCAQSDFRLFHNHHMIEPLREVFDFGTPPFQTLCHEFRVRVMEEAAASGTRLVFTVTLRVDDAEHVAALESWVVPFGSAGLPVSFVQLSADLDVRLLRNRGEARLDAKPSKRDLTWSDANVREWEQYRTNTDPGLPSAADDLLATHPCLTLDTTDLGADEAAARILAWRDTFRESHRDN
jgi:hypothetical protein